MFLFDRICIVHLKWYLSQYYTLAEAFNPEKAVAKRWPARLYSKQKKRLHEPCLASSQLDNDNVSGHPIRILSTQSRLRRGRQEVTAHYHGRLVCPHIVGMLIAQGLWQALHELARLEELTVRQDLVRATFVETHSLMTLSIKACHWGQYTLGKRLTPEFERALDPKQGDTLARLSLLAASNQSKNLEPRSLSVVVLRVLLHPLPNQGMLYEWPLLLWQKALNRANVLLEVENLLFSDNEFQGSDRLWRSRIATPNQFWQTSVVIHLASSPLRPNEGHGHREILDKD
jgi:hypothetical protein